MKNVAYHIKVKWYGSAHGSVVEPILTIPDQQDTPESTEIEATAGITASRLLQGNDRNLRLGEGVRDRRLRPIEESTSESQRRFENNPDGLLAIRTAIYAQTEGELWDIWHQTKTEFSEQRGKLLE